MASANATVAILVSLRDGVTAGLKGMRGAINATFGGLRGLVAGGLGATFANAVKNIALATEEMGRLAASTRSSVEDISRLKFALSTIGKSDDLRGLLNQLAGKQADAIRGPGQTRNAFGQLGLDIARLSKLGAASILREVAEGYAQAGDKARAAAALQAIFGDQFREFLPLLSQGARGFDELANKADKLGATITAREVTDAQEFAKQWREMNTIAESFMRNIALGILPKVIETIKAANELLFERGGLAYTPSDREYLAIASKLLSNPNNKTLNDISPELRRALESVGARFEELGAGSVLNSKGQVETFARSRLQVLNRDEVMANLEREIGKPAKPDDPKPELKEQSDFLRGFRDQIIQTNKDLEDMFELGRRVASALQSAFSSNITSAIRAVRTGALSVKDALDSLLDGLLDDIAEFATQELVKRLISAGLSFIGGGGSSGSGGGNTYGDIGTSPPPSISGAGGGGLLSLNGGGGLKRFGGGGTTINVYGAQTAEEQRSTVSAIMRDQIARNRQVRVQLRGV